MRRILTQLAALSLVLGSFAAFNAAMYFTLTNRLGGNFSDTDQAKMVDVAAYLPHKPTSDLARINTDFALSGDLPVLDGAAALLPVYAAIVDAVYPVGSVTYEGGVFSDDNYYGENFAPDSAMQYRNTVRGYRAIVDGNADILFCAAPSAEQRQYAADRGVELIYTPIGREAFVFFVNQQNPVNTLTAEEIRAIYAGEIRNWADVGGPRRIINPITRLTGSGSQTMMEAFMGERAIGPKSPFAAAGASIGFSFRYYLADMVDNAGVKMLSLNGIYPSTENIKNGTYPVVTEFYAIHRRDEDNPNVSRLIDWILSPEGQAIIEGSGYVGIN